MISRPFPSKKSVFNYVLAHSRATIPNPIPKILPCSLSAAFPSSSISSQNSDSTYKLTHKDWLSPNEVIKIFENLRDPHSIISVWNQYSKRKDYKPNEALYTQVINQLAQAKNFDAIEDIMRKIKLDKSCRLSNDFFHNVIKVYGQLAGRIKKAMETLFDMPKGYNCWPRLCENGDLEAAFNVLDEFPKQRCEPNVRTFSTLMHGLCEKGKVEAAFGLLERMEKEGIDADTITFNILISGLRKQGKVVEGLELLERMKFKGCEPNAGSYQEILYGLLDAEKYVEGKEFMVRMIGEGVDPSFVSYKKLIHGICKERLLRDLDWVLKQMARQGFVPKMGMWVEMVQSVVSVSYSFNHVSVSKIVNCENI
ncbi:PPR CONTAINING PLANT-LIKE PROTEIN [Salix koriyanagi]|uniref:PPR CONTAINING PLANT-LIKE PROTEIN n=1 Tax=Salix koriyanagi TaxID=2511006 RepID=A0A9Q0X1I9_9ROSI|nr:PPR CONTAINING PLANT-LIKE PROTEIN [Salix koriyanagi]